MFKRGIRTLVEREKGMILKNTFGADGMDHMYLTHIPQGISTLYYNKEIRQIEIDFTKVLDSKIAIGLEFIGDYRSAYNKDFESICKEGETVVIWNSISGDGLDDYLKLSKGKYYCQYKTYIKGFYTVKELGPYNQFHINEFNDLLKEFKSPDYVFCASVGDVEPEKCYISCSKQELDYFISDMLKMLDQKKNSIQESFLCDDFSKMVDKRFHDVYDGLCTDVKPLMGIKCYADEKTIGCIVAGIMDTIDDVKTSMKQCFMDEVEKAKRKEVEITSNLIEQLTNIKKLIEAK